MNPDGPTRLTLAVIGGTGIYANVRGQVDVRDIGTTIGKSSISSACCLSAGEARPGPIPAGPGRNEQRSQLFKTRDHAFFWAPTRVSRGWTEHL